MAENTSGVLEFIADEVKNAMERGKKGLVLAGPCPTVKVKDEVAPGGFVVINATDVTDEHELFDDPKYGASKPVDPKIARATHHGGGHWYVVRGERGSEVRLSGPHRKSEATERAQKMNDDEHASEKKSARETETTGKQK